MNKSKSAKSNLKKQMETAIAKYVRSTLPRRADKAIDAIELREAVAAIECHVAIVNAIKKRFTKHVAGRIAWTQGRPINVPTVKM